MDIAYERVETLDVATFKRVLESSGLASRRPVEDEDRLARMLAHSNLLVVAKVADEVIGVARSVTDFAFFCYLADLAVDNSYQGYGIGSSLMEKSRSLAGEETMFLLLAAPDAEPFYDKIGMPKADNAFLYPRER
jgi:ribosomal protein S18 acetylase RimI-like enzyme